MIVRTPVVDKRPRRLLVKRDYKRTPIVDGRRVRPLSDLVVDFSTTHDDVDASLKLASIKPAEEAVWKASHEYMQRASLAYFFTQVISGPSEHPYHGRSIGCEYHMEWDEIVTTKDRFLVEAARDHSKSHYFSVAYPIWRAGVTNPGSLGYIISATQELASELLDRVKQELLTNPRLAHLLPTTKDREWSKKQIKLRNGSIIRARGFGVKIRGPHPQWIIVDDGLSDEDLYSETIRKRRIDFFLSAITNMIDASARVIDGVIGGQIGVVGTPQHISDLYGYLKSTGEYHCRQFPAISKEGKILFVERYNRRTLERRKRELGPARFAREFLCQPLTDEASLFPSPLFEGSDVRIPYRLGLPASYWDEKGWLRYSGVDFAMSSSASADFTVILTIAVDGRGNRWLANIRRGKGWGFQKQLDEIKAEYALMRPEIIHAEANQMQRIFTDEIIRETDLPIRKFYTAGVQPRQPWRTPMGTLTMGKHHIDRGVPGMRLTFENRKWRYPVGDERAVELTDIWRGEFMSMSFQDGKVVSVGDHDDCVMATWMADTAVRIGGFSFSFGAEEVAAASAAAPPGADGEAPPAVHATAQNVEEPPRDKLPSDESGWRPEERAPTAAELGFGGATPFGPGYDGF